MIGPGRRASFEPVSQSARQARAFVREACESWALPADTVILMVDELATNAILHGRTAFSVSARRQAEGLRVEVRDRNPCMPILADVEPEAERGRGLHIVAALARQWGAYPDGVGKIVWFETATEDRATSP